jgi:hypothetical protein
LDCNGAAEAVPFQSDDQNFQGADQKMAGMIRLRGNDHFALFPAPLSMTTHWVRLSAQEFSDA